MLVRNGETGMNKWKTIQVLSAMLMLVSIVVLFGLSRHWTIHIFTVILLLGFLLRVWADNKVRVNQHKDKMRANENEFLDVINHYRHNWLNDLQVIFGYVKLKKYDNLERYMDKIKDKLEEESLIARLNIPSLVIYLLSLRHKNHNFKLHVEVEEGLLLSEVPIHQEEISSAIVQISDLLRAKTKEVQDKENQLTIYIHGKLDSIVLIFSYEGHLQTDEKLFTSEINQLKLVGIKNIIVQVSETSARVETEIRHYLE
jgi:stage 0 sporulation protein B (sporulation initiation phosphotransferase)